MLGPVQTEYAEYSAQGRSYEARILSLFRAEVKEFFGTCPAGWAVWPIALPPCATL